ncbi:zinc finger (CCCH-type) family protein [Actinidia rufa]|uniref:Zinc finger (CCCH-type) family protein n=1 Tax=Actinidia rufa TaxID=165716 RepID=A0A7J0H299_9ERIC|nr:zinc finger (CCCH-type) family protein [Actinidia rufa]
MPCEGGLGRKGWGNSTALLTCDQSQGDLCLWVLLDGSAIFFNEQLGAKKTGFSGGNVVQVLTEPHNNGSGENWGFGAVYQAVWAAEDDYGAWYRETSVDTTSNSDHQTWSRSEPRNKKSRNSQSGHSSSKAIGKMFFKTKMCCKFRAETCPYITNCNFAHSIEELRRPPPNWQAIVYIGETPRSYKGRHCKKFYSKEGCPYGDNCTFLHDEQSKSRESVAISLGPGFSGGYGHSSLLGIYFITLAWHSGMLHGMRTASLWWGLAETEDRDPSSAPPEVKHGVVPSKTPVDTVVASFTPIPHSDGFHNIGVLSQRLSNVIQSTGQRTRQKWKGPDKVSRIYGDWFDDIE